MKTYTPTTAEDRRSARMAIFEANGQFCTSKKEDELVRQICRIANDMVDRVEFVEQVCENFSKKADPMSETLALMRERASKSGIDLRLTIAASMMQHWLPEPPFRVLASNLSPDIDTEQKEIFFLKAHCYAQFALGTADVLLGHAVRHPMPANVLDPSADPCEASGPETDESQKAQEAQTA